MNILQVVMGFPPTYSYGGPAESVFKLSISLRRRNHNVTVFTANLHESGEPLKSHNSAVLDGIRVYYFWNASKILGDRNIIFTPGMFSALGNKTSDFDIVHIHELRHLQAAMGRYWCRKFRVPYVLQPRGSVPRYQKSIQKKVFDTLFGNSLLRDSKRIIASSRLESNQFMFFFPEIQESKMAYIPNGIALEEYRELPNKGLFRDRYGICKDGTVILFLSRIHERKGADLLLKAFERIKNSKEGSAKLVIAGPNEGHLSELMKLTRHLGLDNEVLFPGPLYGREKIEAYCDADVFVLPSKDRYESFGNVVLEASICGTPTVATNVCGVTEWLDSLVTVNPDTNSLYEGICSVLQMTEHERAKLGEALRREASLLSWDRIAEDVEKLYVKVLEETS